MVCGKIIFSNRMDAITAMNGVHLDKRPNKSKNKQTYSYFCTDCNGWHLASNRKTKKRTVSFVQNDVEVNSSQKAHHDQAIKANNQSLIVHSRLNFKVK